MNKSKEERKRQLIELYEKGQILPMGLSEFLWDLERRGISLLE